MIFKTFSNRDDVEECLKTVNKFSFKVEDDNNKSNSIVKKSLLTVQEIAKYLPEFIVLDTETTGFSPTTGDKIVQVAAVRYINMEPAEAFVTLINPERDIPLGVSSIHHIFDRDVVNSPKFWQIKTSLKEFLQDQLIIGHNIFFDIRFLESEGLDLSNNPLADTIYLAKKAIFLPSYKLMNVCNHFNLNFFKYHDALEDVLATGEVFKNVISLLI
jgi:DNA polymerase-3 subunit epsilon